MVAPFFGWERREGAKGGSYTYPGFDQQIFGWFFFVRSSGMFFGWDLRKKIILKLEKGPKKQNEAINFLHVEFLWQVFQGNLSVCDVCAVFLWWRQRKGGCIPAGYHKKTVGIMGKSTFVCSLAIWKEK